MPPTRSKADSTAWSSRISSVTSRLAAELKPFRVAPLAISLPARPAAAPVVNPAPPDAARFANSFAAFKSIYGIFNGLLWNIHSKKQK